MKFDLNRIAQLAGLGTDSTSVLSEASNRSKREDPGFSGLSTDKKGVTHDGHYLAEAAEEEEEEEMETEEMDPIMEARLKHFIQMEVETMIAERQAAAASQKSNAVRGAGRTMGFAGPGFHR
jgi:hypothetical protein